jgi:hypothetical protein
MKQNRLNKRIWTHQGRAWPSETAAGMVLAIILVLGLLGIPVSLAQQAGKHDEVSHKETTPVASTKGLAIWGERKAVGQSKLTQLEIRTVSPKDDNRITAISEVDRQESQVLSASVGRDKGRQIKWQILGSGGANLSGKAVMLPAWLDYRRMHGTVGQTAVGPGSSPSYDMNSGFWQNFLGGFLRGDANADGTVDLADVVYLVNYLYINGPAPVPTEAGNANCDEKIDVRDVVYLINYLLRDGPVPSC